MKHVIETERLFLRELAAQDESELASILCDPEMMRYYPAAFTRQQVAQWIAWNIENYGQYGHGLWAVVLQEGQVFLGDCGITMQEIEGRKLPELGYHIKKEYCNKGYATEAARACIDYAFTTLGFDKLYTYTKRDNAPSIWVAEKIGMRFVKHFRKTVMGADVEEVLYCIRRKNGI